MQNLVSVIIPCYNAEPFLQATLDSVHAQTWPQIEIILVNDGSSDGTAAIIAAQGERVRAVHQDNQGAAASRNNGLALARGEFIQYLDADDLLLPDAIASRVAALTASGADIACGDWQRLNETGSGAYVLGEQVTRTLADVHRSPELATFGAFWTPPAGLLWRRTLVDRMGPWRQDLAPIEDAAYLQRAAVIGARFVHVPGISAHYRIFDGPSHSRRSPLRFVTAVYRNAREHQQRWQDAGVLDAERKALLADCYNYCARGVFRHDPALFREIAQSHAFCAPHLKLAWPRLVLLSTRLVGVPMTMTLLAALGRLPEA